MFPVLKTALEFRTSQKETLKRKRGQGAITPREGTEGILLLFGRDTTVANGKLGIFCVEANMRTVNESVQCTAIIANITDILNTTRTRDII